MCCEVESSMVVPKAVWYAELSEKARRMGQCERADRFLLLAWLAYDEQPTAA